MMISDIAIYVKSLKDKWLGSGTLDDSYPQLSDMDKRLLKASRTNDTSLIMLCINEGADINCHRGNRETALHLSVENGHFEVAQLLVEEIELKIDYKNLFGETALHLAIQRGHRDICKLLLGNGADSNCPDQMGRTCLHLAVLYQQRDLLEMLIENGAEIDREDIFGETPLSISVKNHPNVQIILTLIQNGASVTKDSVWS